MGQRKLNQVLREVRACTLCQDKLPLPPKPLVAAHTESRILIIGQAPGRVAHETGIPWGDKSGDRLRQWMKVDSKTFYNPKSIAIMSMAFCYPGTGSTGDLPPPPECAPLWQQALKDCLPNVALTLYIGRFAIDGFDKSNKKRTLSNLAKNWRAHATKGYFLLPHPSPRNRHWFQKNPILELELIPALQRHCAKALS